MIVKSNAQAPKHLNLYLGLEKAISECLFKQNPAKKVIETICQSNKWGKRDRTFIMETFYNGLRWKRWVEYQMGRPLNKNNTKTFVQTLVYLSFTSIPEIDYFKGFKPLKQQKRKPKISEIISYPDWMINGLENAEDYSELEAMNQINQLVIRVNTLKITEEQLIEKLEREGFQTIGQKLDDNAIAFDQAPGLSKSKLYKAGLFEIQDYHSQKIAKLIKPRNGQLIVDACAGAGGKSLHLADLSNNQARIVALDVRQSILSELKKRKKRSGATCIRIRINGPKSRAELSNKASGLLIDAPCSGSGTIRRQPELKWHLTKG